MEKKIFISCGELSGENHAHNLVLEINKSKSKTKLYGFGSELLKSAGVDLVEDYKDFSFSGITELIPNLLKIFNLKDRILKSIIEIEPDLVILVDYGGFHLELAKAIKKSKLKTKVVQFIAPQIWASRPWRIKKIKKNIDKVFCTLPFEKELYEKENIDVTYVGNPVLASLSPASSKKDLKCLDDEILLGVFPGSRKAEIKYMLPVMIEAVQELKRNFPSLKFKVLLAKAKSISIEILNANGFDKQNDIELFESDSANPNHQLLSAADMLWLCSGTVTLEAAFYSTPYFLAYKSTKLNYFIYGILKTIDMAGLANIIAGKYIVKEFLQDNANAKNFVNETSSWLVKDSPQRFSPDYHQIKSELSKLKGEFVKYDSYKLVAQELM